MTIRMPRNGKDRKEHSSARASHLFQNVANFGEGCVFSHTVKDADIGWGSLTVKFIRRSRLSGEIVQGMLETVQRVPWRREKLGQWAPRSECLT
jgi:hypothetical protein